MSDVHIPIRADGFPGSFPFFGRPEQIGEYTMDRERRMTLGRSDAKYVYEAALSEKKLNFDLNAGFETFEQKSGEDERLDVLLEWITRQAPVSTPLKKVLHEADMVCWRGLLTRIASTPFCDRDAWRCVAVREKNVIFLCEQQTDEAIRRNASMTEKDKMMSYWGFKFEQYMTVDSLQAQPDTSQIVSCREEFATVIRSSIAATSGPPIRLLYSGEVDAVDRDGNLVEMKTQRRALEGGFWRHKSLKWWLQSFLVGIENIVVGFRDDAGIVDRVQSIRVDSLPRQAQWRASASLHCLSQTLTAVRNTLSSDDTACVVEYNPRDPHIVVRPIAKNRADFLTDSFRRHFGVE